ncbi:hypothetical protein V1264_017056 [Littorina saxatilis]|uniref:Uncharacterized protein n=1 Tax=Littorina saxatilis TaxID=31220 RepID=A0AAN9BHR6_9CAEN
MKTIPEVIRCMYSTCHRQCWMEISLSWCAVGGLRLELKFSVPLVEPVRVIVYTEMASLLEIARSRQVITDFTS